MKYSVILTIRRSTEMRPNKFSIDQIIKILAEADLPGSSVSSVAGKYGIHLQTLYTGGDKDTKA